MLREIPGIANTGAGQQSLGNDRPLLASSVHNPMHSAERYVCVHVWFERSPSSALGSRARVVPRSRCPARAETPSLQASRRSPHIRPVIPEAFPAQNRRGLCSRGGWVQSPVYRQSRTSQWGRIESRRCRPVGIACRIPPLMAAVSRPNGGCMLWALGRSLIRGGASGYAEREGLTPGSAADGVSPRAPDCETRSSEYP